MKLLFLFLICISFSFSFLFNTEMAFAVLAESATVPPAVVSPTVSPAVVSPTVSPPSFSGTAALVNPLSGIASITAFFQAILDILLVFAVPFVVFFIIYAGFLYVTARGDSSKIQTAHNALLYAIIGGLLILGAKLILAVIKGTVDDFISMGSNLWLG